MTVGAIVFLIVLTAIWTAILLGVSRAQGQRIAADECSAPDFDPASIVFDPYV